LGGITTLVLSAAMTSTQKVVETIGLLKSQMETTIFTAGFRDLAELKKNNPLQK